MRVSKEPVCAYLFRQNPIFTYLPLRSPVRVVPPRYTKSCTSYEQHKRSLSDSVCLWPTLFIGLQIFSQTGIFLGFSLYIHISYMSPGDKYKKMCGGRVKTSKTTGASLILYQFSKVVDLWHFGTDSDTYPGSGTCSFCQWRIMTDPYLEGPKSNESWSSPVNRKII